MSDQPHIPDLNENIVLAVVNILRRHRDSTAGQQIRRVVSEALHDPIPEPE